MQNSQMQRAAYILEKEKKLKGVCYLTLQPISFGPFVLLKRGAPLFLSLRNDVQEATSPL